MTDVKPWSDAMREFMRDGKPYAVVPVGRAFVARKGAWQVTLRNNWHYLSGTLIFLMIEVGILIGLVFAYVLNGGWYTWMVVFIVLASQTLLRALLTCTMILAGDT